VRLIPSVSRPLERPDEALREEIRQVWNDNHQVYGAREV